MGSYRNHSRSLLESKGDERRSLALASYEWAALLDGAYTLGCLRVKLPPRQQVKRWSSTYPKRATDKRLASVSEEDLPTPA